MLLYYNMNHFHWSIKVFKKTVSHKVHIPVTHLRNKYFNFKYFYFMYFNFSEGVKQAKY